MRMINAGYQLYRTDVVAVKMAKENRYLVGAKWVFSMAFGITKILKRHPTRASVREFLPWIGVIIAVIIFSGINYWYAPAGLYTVVLSIEGIRTFIVK